MELIQGLIQPPKVQSVDETIPTLSDRAESATLIGDRRSAVLGLKAFSRDYREAVIASGLKPLLNTLKRDYEDESTVKAILETLLILFIRGDGSTDLTRSWISQQSRLQNGKYPSPLVMKQELEQVDQFSLWIADAITQSDEIIHLILELLETGNFHVRLYTIQLLEAVVATRPTRSRNAINSLPTGISTLVSLLEDAHEPVRDEAVLLLMAVVNDSPHVQKLVAFENIFDRLFTIIEEEGGLRGSLVVNDCLSLINNILKFNTSNQSLFLETGNLPKLARILDEPLLEKDFFWNDQRIINIKTALDIVSLTVEPGSSTTAKNQTLLLESNVLMIVLRMAFYDKIPKKVRPIALLTAAAMIRGNDNCQRNFGKIDVPFFDPSSPNSSQAENTQLLPVVGLLIHWILFANSVQSFPIRVASLELIKAYLYDNTDIQIKFLSQQIEGYNDRNDSQQNDQSLGYNLLEALLDYDPDIKLNPYKIFFAADLFMSLLHSENKASSELRELARQVQCGAEVDGAEKLSFIQTLSELLATSLSAEDIRVPISYASLLIFWLFGDQNAINEFLSERSVVQSLSSFCYQLQDDNVTIKCLVTMLLGISYEFSTKDSPFPRKDYYEYISKTIGRDNYLSRINQLREDSLLTKEQDLGTVLTPAIDETGLPQVYFSPIFTEFLADNSYRIKSALFRKPEEEPILNLSFEAFEELQKECLELKERISALEESSKSKIDLLTKDYGELEKAYQSCNDQKKSIDEEYSALKLKCKEAENELHEATSTIRHLREQESHLSKWKEEKTKVIKLTESRLTEMKESSLLLEKNLRNLKDEKEKAENGINKMNRELLQLTKENDKSLETIRQLEKLKNKTFQEAQGKEKDLENLREQHKALQDQFETLQEQHQKASTEIREWEAKFRNHDELVSKLTGKLRSVAENFQKTRKERDGLLSTVESQKAELKQAEDGFNAEINSLSAKNSELMKSQDDNISQLSKLKQTVQRLEQAAEAEKTSSSDNIKVLEAEVYDLKQELKALNAQKEALEKHNKELNDSIKKHKFSGEESSKALAEMQEEFQSAKRRLKELETEKKKAEDIASAQERKIKEALEELKAVEIECQTKAQTVCTLENEIKRNKELHDHEITTLKADELKVSSTVIELERSLSKEKQRCSSLEAKLERVRQDGKKELEKSNTEVAQSNEKIKNLEKRAEDLQAESQNIEKQKSIAERDLEIKKEEVQKLLPELDKAKAIVDKKEAALKQLQEDKEASELHLRETKDSYENARTDYESKIQELQSKLKERAKEFETERKLLNEGSNSVTQEYSKRIGILEDKIDEVEKECEKTKLDLESSQKNLERLKKDSELSLKERQDVVTSLDAENSALKEKTRDCNERYKKLKDATEKESTELKRELDALKQSMKKASESKDAENANLRKTKEEVADELTKKIEVLEEERAGLEQAVKDLSADRLQSERDFQSQLETLSKDYESVKNKLEKLSDMLKEEGVTDFKSLDLSERLKLLKDKVAANDEASIHYESVITEHEKQISSLSEKNASLNAEVGLKENELTQMRSLAAVKSKEAEDVRETERLEVQQLRDQLAAVQKQNEELLSKAKNDSELDDLMLLVTDLDEQNARYLELLRTNGIEIPDNDDDDDDDDDADEGEEEEDEEDKDGK